MSADTCADLASNFIIKTEDDVFSKDPVIIHSCFCSYKDDPRALLEIVRCGYTDYMAAITFDANFLKEESNVHIGCNKTLYHGPNATDLATAVINELGYFPY